MSQSSIIDTYRLPLFQPQYFAAAFKPLEKFSLLRMHRYQCFRLYRLHHLLYPRPVDVPAGVKTRPFPVPPQSPVKLKAEIINPVPYPLVVYELSSSKASLEEYMYVPPFGCMSRNAWKS